MITTNVAHDKFLTALLAPFGGKETHDDNGQPLPSTSQKNWTFTLHNTLANTHVTFKARRPKGWTVESPVLVDMMVGTDNESDFAFVGSVRSNGVYSPSPKCKAVGAQADKAHRTLTWLMAGLASNTLPEALEIKAESKCCRCGRKLTNPESIDDAMGPICRGKA